MDTIERMRPGQRTDLKPRPDLGEVSEVARRAGFGGKETARLATKKVALEHAHVTRCLRSARSAFSAIAAEAGEQDIKNTQTVQTSSGTGLSTGSEGGRAGSPLLRKGNAGVLDWLDRARVGARR